MEQPYAPPSDAGTLRASWHWYRPEHARMVRALLFSRWPFRLILAGVVVFVAYQAVRVVGDLVSTWSMTPWWLVLGLLWLYVLFVAGPRSHAAAYGKNHTGLQRVSISHDGVETGCDTCSLTVRWEGIGRVAETRDFFLFLSPGLHLAAYLPKRALDGKAGVQAVRDFVRLRVAERARLRDGVRTNLQAEAR